MARTDLPVLFAQRAKAASPGPKPVTVRREGRLKDRLQHPKHRLLDDSVPDRRNSQRPLTPIRLGNQNPLDRERSISARLKLRDQFKQILFESLPEFLYADPIHSGCPMIGTHLFVGGFEPPKLQHLPHEAMVLPPLLHQRAKRLISQCSSDPKTSVFPLRSLPRLLDPTHRLMLLFAPSLWPLFAPREAPFGSSLALRSRAQITPLSRRFPTTTEALTSRRASLRPFGLCLIASLIPPALRPCGMNTIVGNTTRSPQVKRLSFSPCRPHTPCLKARWASISFALRLQARLSALTADRFASGLRLGYGPQIQRMPFGFHLTMDTLPSPLHSSQGRRSTRLLVYASPLPGCG